MDKVIKSVHPDERKIVPHRSPPVPILMVGEAKSAAEKSTQDIAIFVAHDQSLLARPNMRKPKYITVDQQVVLKAICETTALVSAKVAGLLEVIPHPDVAEKYA